MLHFLHRATTCPAARPLWGHSWVTSIYGNPALNGTSMLLTGEGRFLASFASGFVVFATRDRESERTEASKQ
jgi:hypothetical protein